MSLPIKRLFDIQTNLNSFLLRKEANSVIGIEGKSDLRLLKSEELDKFLRREIYITGQQLYLLNRVLFFQPNGLLSFNRKILAISALGRLDRLRITLAQHMAFLLKGNTKRKKLAFVVSLVNEWNKNYFHWIVESFPRIDIIRSYFDNWEDITWVIPKGPSYIRDSLLLVGIHHDKIIENGKYNFEMVDCIIPSYPRENGLTDPTPITRLSKILVDSVNKVQKKSSGPRRIFISRKNARLRRIKNEEELFDHLIPLSFEKVYLENYNLADQITLFSNAEIVISPHGAGLSNIIFLNKRTPVIEIFGNYYNPCYYYLAVSLDLQYMPAFGESIGEDIYISEHLMKGIMNIVYEKLSN